MLRASQAVHVDTRWLNAVDISKWLISHEQFLMLTVCMSTPMTCIKRNRQLQMANLKLAVRDVDGLQVHADKLY